jgi:diaminohydroxyphosphoribosylaminopyrimidine deaminase/5-amino-6-(5-phosphoribosylamino)uracil reductase
MKNGAIIGARALFKEFAFDLTSDVNRLYSEFMPQQEETFMRRTLQLARRGRGKTSPNPMVGAVIARDGVIVGEAYHAAPGQPHAEVLALAKAGRAVKGATLYTNLEPCCHTAKRTPPCTDAIIGSGIQRVVAAMTDPNPMVSGKGFQLLRKAGIEVVEGVLRPEAERLNEIFIKYITTQKPFVILKAAMTLDGRIATRSGSSRWITGEAARLEVHRLRSEVDAVLVGIGTVLIDDPLLTARRRGAKNPIRVVIDPTLKIPLHARMMTSMAEAPILLLTTSRASSGKMKKLKEKGALIELFPQTGGEISFDAILERLGKAGVTSLLIEGGGKVNGLALRANAVDRAIFYIAPKLLCGEDAKGVIAGKSVQALSQAIRLDHLKVKQIGEDIRIEGHIRKGVGAE